MRVNRWASRDEYLVFYEENQGVVLWGIRKEDLRLDNPAILGCYDIDGGQWFEDAMTTEGFLLSMAYWNGVLGGLKYCANAELDSHSAVEIMPIVEQHWNEQTGITNQFLRFFTVDHTEIVVLTTDETGQANGIYIASNNEQKFRNMTEILCMEWDYRSDED